MHDTVYFDNAATTPIDPRVLDAMLPFLRERFANTSSRYALGRDAAGALEKARADVAGSIGAAPGEIVFTSGGTESDNAAVIGLTRAGGRSRGHVVVSAFEHEAVLAPARRLASHGFDLTELRPRPDGAVDPDDLASVMRDDTVLVSIMHANNEIGTVQPLASLSAVAHDRGALMHTDACQSAGKIDVDVDALGVDALSLTAHKFYGPKGVGCLYLREGVPFEPYLIGAHQEASRRAGTPNVAGAVGLATALGLMDAERAREAPRLEALRDRLIEGVLRRVADARANGVDAPRRLPHLASFLLPGVDGAAMLDLFDAEGIAVSTGAACTAGSATPSHVLEAIGCAADRPVGALRVSLGRFTTGQDVDRFLACLTPVLTRAGSHT